LRAGPVFLPRFLNQIKSVMQTYRLRRIQNKPLLNGNLQGSPWREIEPLSVDSFPWYASGKRQRTTVKLCYDARALYLLFWCEDSHISAECTNLNDAVCRDSCVEFFCSLPPDGRPDYVNLEMNCCGVMHMGYGPDMTHRRMVTPELAAGIRVFHTVPGAPKKESPKDREWLLEVELPFKVLSDFVGHPVEPRGSWRANFYRCGGITDAQYACWSPVGTPRPNFHQPKYFGVLEFED